jgi:tetratricopeptide (TPR) repeat protein
MKRALLQLGVAVVAAALGAPAPAVEPGERVDDAELIGLAGGKEHLVPSGPAVNVLVFAKTNHPHCLETLRELASLEGKQAGVRWVAILPGDTNPAEARALASTTGVKMKLLLDTGDRIYGSLQVKLHPTIVILDRQGRVAAYEPFREINYGTRVTARIRFLLGEITEAELAEAIDPREREAPAEDKAARSHARYAAQLLQLGQLDLALAEVNKSLAIAPTAEAYSVQGKILARQGKCGDASRAFEVALRLEPSNGVAAAEKGRCTPARASP